MIRKCEQLKISEYQSLYDIVIPQDHLLRKIKELVDFSFVYDELVKNYSITQGREAIDMVMMFKKLFLKDYYELSDEDLMSRVLYDMSFKYFLGMTPEETNLIHPSTLTKFRKLRLKDMNLLDLLIKKTVEIAIANGVLKSRTLLVDSTHTQSKYNQKSASQVLLDRAKRLRKEIYTVNENYKEKLPPKVENGSLEDIIDYCQRLAKTTEAIPELSIRPRVKERLNYLNEGVQDDIEALALSKDEDARIGHKTSDSSFLGYKTHLGMSEERIITSAVITTGETSDGKQLKTLVEKSQEAGLIVDEIIGDTAYSEKGNIEYAKDHRIKLISKLNPVISQGNRSEEDKFEFNKDAGLYVCPAGHMAYRKTCSKRDKTNKNERIVYYFDVEKCKSCPHREGCYKEGAKTKSYSVSILADLHKEQLSFQETDYFKERAKERYMIEAKNSELKHRHGYDVASLSGLVGMEIQGAFSIFAVNLKRILKLMAK